MNPTQPDAIIAEIHALREQLAKRYHNDLKAYSAAAEAHCRALGFAIAESPRRRVVAEQQEEKIHAVPH